MIAKKFFIYTLIILLTVYPASAGEVTLNKWVLNVMLHEDGTVEEIIQTEIENGGSSSLDGFSFVVPALRVTMPNVSTFSPTGQVVELQTVSGGTRIIINFNSSVKAGEKWDGRIDFNAENWAVKEGMNYSINIPVEAPQAIVSGKNSKMLSDRIKDAKAQGRDVSEAELHLLSAEDYNNQALDDFWEKKDATSALDAANNEMI